ncbi:MAG: ABC transporter permease subunit [Acidimicrobiia bacterium]
MSADIVELRTEAAIARRAFNQLWIGAAAWALVFGGTVAASALSYVSSFPTAASRHQLAITTRGDTGLAVLLGSVSSIDTVGGYTVYKCFVFLTTIGAIWAIVAATRLLRSEEDTGRWQLLLAGNTRPARVTAATLSALGAAVAIVFGGTTLITVVAGRNAKVGFGVGEAVLYGLSIAVAPAVFGAVGALTSQLGSTRRMATGLGIGAFGLSFIVRMFADSGPHARWLLWATPFGWTELMRPLTHNDPWPLVPAAMTVVALSGAAIVLASRRDTGAGVLAARDMSSLRPFGLSSPSQLALRLEFPVLSAWLAGVAAAAFVFGIIVKVTTGKVPASLAKTLGKFGVKGAFANQYFGVAFLLVATLVALLPASQIGAASDEETSGRLVHVLAQPVQRARLFAGRLLLSGVAIAVSGLLAGLAAWLGAKTQGVNLHFASMVGAGLNVVPTALVTLGIGAVLLSVAPRRAARTVYGVVMWSLLIDLLGSIRASLSWLDRLSLFHYMALAPAQRSDPKTLAVTVTIALAMYVVATIRFARRDVQRA